MRLKTYLKQKWGMQKQLAAALGIPATTLKSYQDGRREAGISIAFAIEDYTEGAVTARDLLDEWKERNGVAS